MQLMQALNCGIMRGNKVCRENYGRAKGCIVLCLMMLLSGGVSAQDAISLLAIESRKQYAADTCVYMSRCLSVYTIAEGGKPRIRRKVIDGIHAVCNKNYVSVAPDLTRKPVPSFLKGSANAARNDGAISESDTVVAVLSDADVLMLRQDSMRIAKYTFDWLPYAGEGGEKIFGVQIAFDKYIEQVSLQKEPSAAGVRGLRSVDTHMAFHYIVRGGSEPECRLDESVSVIGVGGKEDVKRWKRLRLVDMRPDD